MAKHKIPKNRSLEDMFKGVKEEITFETADWDDEPAAKPRVVQKPAKKQTASDFRKQFFTDDLQEKVGSLLLEIKMATIKTASEIFPWKSSRTAATSSSRRGRRQVRRLAESVLGDAGRSPFFHEAARQEGLWLREKT